MEKLKLAQLKEQCRALKLKVSGTKAVLIERLQEAQRQGKKENNDHWNIFQAKLHGQGSSLADIAMMDIEDVKELLKVLNFDPLARGIIVTKFHQWQIEDRSNGGRGKQTARKGKAQSKPRAVARKKKTSSASAPAPSFATASASTSTSTSASAASSKKRKTAASSSSASFLSAGASGGTKKRRSTPQKTAKTKTKTKTKAKAKAKAKAQPKSKPPHHEDVDRIPSLEYASSSLSCHAPPQATSASASASASASSPPPAKTAVYYGVHKGWKPGVYESWGDVKRYTYNYNNPKFRKFSSYAEADEFASTGVFKRK